ncbi:MAG: transposase family protein [Saprospiraceae bacterium]|jgi:hypothetical protein|nr:transposase family protein [Lewinellaceae bacterium]
MSFGYTGIRNERQWKATTGMSQTKFLELSQAFGQAFEGIYGCSIQERQSNSSQEATFRSYEEMLFFLLFSLKSGLTYDALGAIFDCDGSTAKTNQTNALPILKAALSNLGLMPKRSFSSVEDFETYFAQHDTLLVDGTEQQIQRSKDNSVQKAHYSGKKKSHR